MLVYTLSFPQNVSFYLCGGGCLKLNHRFILKKACLHTDAKLNFPSELEPRSKKKYSLLELLNHIY